MGVMLPHSLRASATFGLRRITSMAMPASESSTAGSGPRKRASITASVSGLSSNLFTLMSGPGKSVRIESCSLVRNALVSLEERAFTNNCA